MLLLVHKVILVLAAFLFMEFVAWFSHKYVMHGFLWILHKDHHKEQHNRFERNDLFALIFATPAILFIYFGAAEGFDFRFWIGLGIATYGLAYFLYHDILVHQRLNLFGTLRWKYLNAIIRAHYDHHRGKKNYGFLFMVPWRYFREEFSK